MITNNSFFIKNLKQIVIIGWCPNLNELLDINKKLKLKTLIISSPNQKKNFKENNNLFFFENLDNAKFKSFLKKKIKIDETLFLSISSFFIFKEKTIKLLKGNLINYFPSRLPFDKGRGGFSWHIMRNDRILNNCFHLIDDKINTGPIIKFKPQIFPSSCQIPIEFENFKWKEMKNLYEEFINQILNKKKFKLYYQLPFIGNHNPALKTIKNGFIDWSLKSTFLIRFINAFDDPFPGASTFHAKFGRIFIKKAHLHSGERMNHPYMSGLILRHDKNWITVSTNDENCLLIENVLDKNRKNILNKLTEGDRLYTPEKKLLDSKINLVTYKP